MGKLIDADEFVEWLLADAITDEQRKFAEKVRYAAEKMKPVDAVPVRRGRWIDETFKPWGLVHHPYKCDQCGEHSEAPSDYCPHCGARNIEGDDES